MNALRAGLLVAVTGPAEEPNAAGSSSAGTRRGDPAAPGALGRARSSAGAVFRIRRDGRGRLRVGGLPCARSRRPTRSRSRRPRAAAPHGGDGARRSLAPRPAGDPTRRQLLRREADGDGDRSGRGARRRVRDRALRPGDRPDRRFPRRRRHHRLSHRLDVGGGARPARPPKGRRGSASSAAGSRPRCIPARSPPYGGRSST